MSQARVTVVIPAYQASRTIARPLSSLLAQTRVPDEIIVVDDGSKDDLAAAIEPYAARAQLVRKTNGGAASARNLGIERASGEFIAFLDADDYWEPAKLQRQLEMFQKYPELGMVGCTWFEEPPGETRFQSQIGSGPGEAAYYGKTLRASGRMAFDVAMCMWTSTLLIRRNVLGAERFVSGLEPAEDRDLWLRLVPKTAVFLLPELLATYVLEPNSLSRASVDRDCGNMLRVVHRHAHLLGERGTREQEEIVYMRWAAGHLSRGNGGAAIAPAWMRLKKNPLSAQGWWVLGKSMAMSVLGRGQTAAV
jgi:glycosyltransferase involved in cell wall biosynthesis